MAQDNDVSREDRTLPASERRLQKAREDGNVPRSRDLGHALVIGGAFAGLSAAGPALGEATLELVRAGLRFPREAALQPQRALESAASLGSQALVIVAPVSAVLAVLAVAGSVAMGGLLFTTKPLAPQFSRVNPMSGLSRIFSRDGAVDLAKLVLLAIALLGLAAWFVAQRLPQLIALTGLPPAQGLALSWGTILDGLRWLVGLLALVALIDAPLQWLRHRANLRMTIEEAKQEGKESEGDPHTKARIRGKQREMARSRMLAAVPRADVVVTNPTHYAVALRYDEASMAAPRVVAKGADHLAAKIREIARQAGVPLLEAPPLARALYTHAEIDRDIPVALYTAVAQVLAYVFQLRRFVPGRTPAPREPHDIEVPADLDPAAGGTRRATDDAARSGDGDAR